MTGADRMPIFDAHFHIVDPRFPVTPNQGYVPPAFTVADYRERVRGLGVTGGAVVSGSFHGFDQSCLLDALSLLGPGFVGVTQLPATVTDDEITRLNDAGVRGIRFNIRRGGSESVDHLGTLARRVHDVAGWHTELYVDARALPELTGTIAALPAVSIDHLGLSAAGLPHLAALVDRGVRVKATGFGRVDFDVAPALRAVADRNPHALMFGTDLPSTRAPRPFLDADVEIVTDALGPELAARVLHDNAAQFYRVR
ncbi:amidohydrolase family protein [Rhodococcus rhodochrous]|uniref:2-pyrone-4,6-dicarboxylate hydrolase n=1 Tax=Rhodococcus rhodochrous KG-21 TaxID=1441923 RepID=A0A0M8PJJ6_RHORH|nr:amidohydrolase family protein [Rhodococcus rhodochrous]KOS53469.1 2-pyrone-4,6-dicarboxylate hydrolase [Rhodococcus rhodochrous KG-21]